MTGKNKKEEKDPTPGEVYWLIRESYTRTPIKLVCPSCRGNGFTSSVLYPCSNCSGKEFIRKQVTTYEVVGSVKIRSISYQLGEDESPTVEVLRPPLYLLSTYENDVVKMCEDYWEDFEKGRTHAGAYAHVVKDVKMLCPSYEAAVERANDLTNYNIQDACDQEKTVLYDRPEDVFRQTAVGQAKADSVEIFKETEIEKVLC